MKKMLSIILLLMLVVSLTACDSKNTGSDDASRVDIYYIDSKNLSLVTEKYDLIGTDTNDQVYELLHMIKKAPENPLYKSVLPDKITYSYSINEDKTLIINFDSVYEELKGIEEVLCRAAIVKTLTQLDDVEFIQFNVNGNSLVIDGDVVRTLTADDFIDITDTNTNYRVKLYFANEEGDALIEYDTDINYTGNSSLEELTIRKLINGPTKLGMRSAIPEGTVLLNVSKNDGICTVNFNEKFLEKIPDINEELAIYSVVNTLVELPNINKVQFTINSQVKETFWDKLNIDGLFERNLNLIEEAE